MLNNWILRNVGLLNFYFDVSLIFSWSQYPEVDVAITHDDDWMCVIEDVWSLLTQCIWMNFDTNRLFTRMKWRSQKIKS